MTVVAAVCAGLAAALLLGVPTRIPGRAITLRGWPARGWVLVAAVAGLAATPGGHATAVLVEAAAGALAVGWLLRRARQRTRADATRLQVVEACEAIVSELRAGQPPLAALEHAQAGWPAIAPVAAACRLDADVPLAFRRLAAVPGAGSLEEIAAAWQLSQRIGAGLAPALDRVVSHARAELSTHRAVATELASANATARMMALLPLVTLTLSAGSGTDPWHFLLATTAGVACLGAGGVLAFAGMWWIDRIVTSAS